MALAALLLRLDFRLAWRQIWPRSVIASLWLSVLAYLPALLLAIIFLDAGIPVEDRILSPALVLVIVAAFSTASQVAIPEKMVRWVRWSLGGLYGAYLLAGLIGLARFVMLVHAAGSGFTSQAWKTSPTIAALRALPPTRPIYSNGEEGIYPLTRKSTYSLPKKTDASYPEEIAALRRDLVQKGGLLVIFSDLRYRDFLSQEEIVQALPPLETMELADGVVLSLNRP